MCVRPESGRKSRVFLGPGLTGRGGGETPGLAWGSVLSFSCSRRALSTSCVPGPECLLSGPPGPTGEVPL